MKVTIIFTKVTIIFTYVTIFFTKWSKFKMSPFWYTPQNDIFKRNYGLNLIELKNLFW